MVLVVVIHFLQNYRFRCIALFVTAGISASATGHAAEPSNVQDRAGLSRLADAGHAIEAFGDKFSVASRAPLAQARIFVYRLADSSQNAPVNIYLDGRYHTSLLKGGYSEFCMAQFQVPVQVALDDARQLHKGKQAPAQLWTLQAGKSLFLKVQEGSDARAVLVEIPSDQAQRELPGTALQIHTVSRAPLAQPCQSPAAAPAVAEVKAAVPMPLPLPLPASPVVPSVHVAKTAPLGKYALDADELFDFGQSKLKPTGQKVLDTVARKLQRDFAHIERIRLTGHSDPMGKASANQKLSLQRAQTVLRELQKRGLRPSQGFAAAGKGAEQLVKTRCGTSPSAENKSCNAPNRRVEVAVTGTRR